MTTPPEDALAERLRHEVRRLKTLAGRQRAVPTLLNVGALGGARIVVPVGVTGRDDAALPADLLTRALERLRDPVLRSVWLTRGGALVVGEDDLRWRVAAETAFARHGVAEPGRLACFVVTRHGCLDVHEERSREWPRLRPDARHAGASLAPHRDDEGAWALVS